jgi:hypothetical protein
MFGTYLKKENYPMKKPSHQLRHAQRTTNPMSSFELLNCRNHAALDEERLRYIDLSYLGALHGMKAGHGNEQIWSTLACSLCIALVLAEQGVMPQALRVIEMGQDALVRVRVQSLQNGEWRLGIHAFSVESAFKIYDQQVKIASEDQIISAINEVHRRVDARYHR